MSLSVERGCIGIARHLLFAGARMLSAVVLVATNFRQSAMVHFLFTLPFVDPNVATTAGVTALLVAAASG
jgi:ABC-type spermidine/putrescine transport system permease subunit II